MGLEDEASIVLRHQIFSIRPRKQLEMVSDHCVKWLTTSFATVMVRSTLSSVYAGEKSGSIAGVGDS